MKGDLKFPTEKHILVAAVKHFEWLTYGLSQINSRILIQMLYYSKIGWAPRANSPNPPFLARWVEVLNPPICFGPSLLTSQLGRLNAGAGWVDPTG